MQGEPSTPHSGAALAARSRLSAQLGFDDAADHVDGEQRDNKHFIMTGSPRNSADRLIGSSFTNFRALMVILEA